MIEIVQAGQAGKTSLLIDMHRLRKRIFKDRMGWDVQDNDGLEVDQFDIPEAIYLLALDQQKNVIGTWRILKATGPTMIRDIWPESLNSLPIPNDDRVWEVSRFGVHSYSTARDVGLNEVNQATSQLFCALTELGIMCGIKSVFTLYDARIARLLKRLDCQALNVSEPFLVDGRLTQTGCFATDHKMLSALRSRAGIKQSLVSVAKLPPSLRAYARTPADKVTA